MLVTFRMSVIIPEQLSVDNSVKNVHMFTKLVLGIANVLIDYLVVVTYYIC